MGNETTLVTVVYDHPDIARQVRYEQYLALNSIGAVLLVMDALADVTDPNEIQELSARIAGAVSG